MNRVSYKSWFCRSWIVLMLMLFVLSATVVWGFADEFFTIHMAVGTGGYAVKLAEVIQGELAKIGIKVRTESVEWTTILARMRRAAAEGLESFDEGGYDMYALTLSGGAFEPSGLARYVHTDARGSFNVWNYYNPVLDEELDLGTSKASIEERKPHYLEAGRILWEQQPVIVLDYPAYVYVFKKGWEGFKPYRVNQPLGSASFWQMTFEGKPASRMIAAISMDIRSPNPLFDWTGTGKETVGGLVFDSLVELDEELRPLKPALAESWEISDEGRTFTFHLRDGVYWHDGVKFTSNDVKFSFEARMDPSTGAEHHSKFDVVDSVATPDDYTVVVHLKDLYAPFLFDVGMTAIVPAHVFEGLSHEELADSPYTTGDKMLPGTGPMQIVEWNMGERILLKANPNYFGGKPTVEEIIWTIIPSSATALAALEAGEVDCLSRAYNYTADVPRLREGARFTVETYNSLVTRVLGINNAHPILSNKWVRQAISHAIPRAQLCEVVQYGLGTPGSQFLGPWSWGYNTELPAIEYDIDLAIEYMEKAGYKK